VPDYPYNLFPWIFLALVVLGLAWYLAVRLRTPQVVEEIGSFEEEPVPPGTVHPHPAEHGHHGRPGASPADGYRLHGNTPAPAPGTLPRPRETTSEHKRRT
jgi:hypothetical protein